VLKMKGYIDNLERLGQPVGKNLAKDANAALHAIRAGRVQKNQKNKPHKAAKGGHGKGKGKMGNASFASKPKTPPPPKKDNPAKDGLRGSKKLKPGALSLYMGDGHRTTVEAIGTYHLELPSGLVIFLNNCHYAPSITRVSKNNFVYFMAVPRDGIYEIDMTCTNTNDSSIKKRIEKLQHDGLLNSIDIESLGKYVSCMSGKMVRKPYSHQVERAKDLLGLIHTDVCGPFKIVSRQGASYFVTFTDDFSRYGYVYLLKHKHEVFETFKVFQKEVENQLGKTIKSLCSDREGEYMSQDFLDHLKEHGIIAHCTPPYTPQNNGVSERRNRTLLYMVRSMMSQTTLPKSFWDYALETSARILNMVPTKKVDNTPYEIWHGQAPKLSYLKVWGYRMCLYIDAEEYELGDLGEPANYKAALLDPESKKWLDAMNVEMQSMKDNDVWVLVELPPNARTEAVWIRKFISGLGIVPTIEEPISMYCDNTGAIAIAKDDGVTKGARHFRAKVHYLRETIKLGDLGEPANYKAALLDPESKKWLDVMNVEMQSMKDNDVWVLVELPLNARTVGSKWLFKKKTDMDGAVYIFKARLVAKGFTQTYGVDYEETFSPRFDDEIKKFSFTQNLDEPCVYIKASGSYVAILTLYVDDILLMGNNIPMLQGVKSYLGRSFAMKDLGEAAYILGIKIYRDRSKQLIGLCQNAYIEKILKRFYMENSKRGTIPMQEKLKLGKSQGASTPAEKQRMQNIPYASAVGSIMYAVRCTRPGVAFAQNMTSRFQQNPGEEHWTAVKNILKYLRNTKDMFLVYGGNMERELRVSFYTDAGYLTDADNLNSQTGYVSVLNGAAVDWKSTKQSIFATSSTDAEYIAAFDASKEAVWIRKFISGLGLVPTIEEPISMYCDNTGAIAIAKDDGVTKGARHFRAKVHYLRETIKLGDVKIEKIHTDDNLADPFTKVLAFPKHSKLTRNIGLLPASSFIRLESGSQTNKKMKRLHDVLWRRHRQFNSNADGPEIFMWGNFVPGTLDMCLQKYARYVEIEHLDHVKAT
nr:retrotransposon protein, putative, Ty1-copia subclass [Tanacetum cinerariifolium]